MALFPNLQRWKKPFALMLAVYGKKESKKNGIVAGNNVFSGIFVKQILCVPKEQLLLGIACFNKKS